MCRVPETFTGGFDVSRSGRYDSWSKADRQHLDTRRGYTHLRDFDTLVTRVYELECLVSAMFRGEHLVPPENGAGFPSIESKASIEMTGSAASGSRAVRFAGSGTDGQGSSRDPQQMTMNPMFDRQRSDSLAMDVAGFEGYPNDEDNTFDRRGGSPIGRAFGMNDYEASRNPSMVQRGPAEVMASLNPSLKPPVDESRMPHTPLPPKSNAGWRPPDRRKELVRPGGISEPASKAPSLTEHDAALLLEDMVYDRNVMRDGATGLSGKRFYSWQHPSSESVIDNRRASVFMQIYRHDDGFPIDTAEPGDRHVICLARWTWWATRASLDTWNRATASTCPCAVSVGSFREWRYYSHLTRGSTKHQPVAKTCYRLASELLGECGPAIDMVS